MSDPLYWQLVYPNGDVVREPAENASIMVAPKGADVLYLVRPDGVLALKVDLEGKRPIFYRVRSQVLPTSNNGARPQPSAPPLARLDATVFGRGWETDNQIHATLWATIGRHKEVVNCPAALFDAKMLELQTTY